MFINTIRKYVKKAIRVIKNVKALQGRRKVIQAGKTKNGCMEEEVGPEKIRRIWLSEDWGMAAQRVENHARSEDRKIFFKKCVLGRTIRESMLDAVLP